MKTNLLKKIFKFTVISFVIMSLYSCSEDDEANIIIQPGPAANTISGVVTFVDTNFVTSGGYYDIGIFPNPSTPPAYWFGPPSANDTLHYVKVGNEYRAEYNLQGVADGDYVVAVGFRKDTGGQSPIMGVYGCDTSHTNCFLDPIRVSITNNQGVDNVNFLSWADTTNKVF